MAESKTDEAPVKNLAPVIKQENKFTKQSMLHSNLFSTVEKDILTIVLDSEKTYTVEEAHHAIDVFEGGI